MRDTLQLLLPLLLGAASACASGPCDDAPSNQLACWDVLPELDAGQLAADELDGVTADDAGHGDLRGVSCVPVDARLNELLANPAGADEGHEYVELVGPPGASASDLVLEGLNGSTGEAYLTQTLVGAFDGSGILMVGGAAQPLASPLQNGPDALRLIACGVLLDQVIYGAAPLLPAGDVSEIPAEAMALGRCDDGFRALAPTPGAPNTSACVPACPEALASFRIQALLVDPAGADAGLEYVVVAGAPATELTGLTLVAVNGNDGAPYGRLSLDGAVSDAAGALQIGPGGLLSFTLQNGPDAVWLEACGEVVDQVGYGVGAEAISRGTPAPQPGTDEVLWRVSDTDDNATDFEVR